MRTPDALAADAPFDRLVQVASEVYRALGPALRAANAMDFDDLLLHPLTLFQERPDRLTTYQERFQFLLIDEFQDTNLAQYLLVRRLGHHGNVAAVGDDDQSIYSWRGADVRNMLDFQRDFPGTRMVRLEENYRSSQIVLDAANAVINENTARIGKVLHTQRRGGENVTLVAAADERDEAEWIVRELSARQARGEHAASDMAVLYRTNAQSRALEEAFRRAGVPYRLVGAVSFYERREVKDLLAYLRLIANPADDEAFLRAIAVPRRGLGEASLVVLQEQAARWKKPLLETASIAERIEDLRPNAREAFRQFAELIARIRNTVGTTLPAPLLEQLVAAIDFEARLLEEGPEGAERWENVRELIASAAEWSEESDPDPEEPSGTPLDRFLSEAVLVSANDQVAGDERGVTLMTLHTAKGLEWPVVVIAGMEDGLFPLARAEEEREGLEEERRLCYVGLTRAKDKLYLSWARARRRGGELRPARASRFLSALPPAIVEERRTSGMWSLGGGMRRSGGWSEGRISEPVSPPATVSVAAEDESQDRPRYLKGERVRHRRFGAGIIQGLTGTGRDLKVAVAFDNEEVGVKHLLVAYAGLERDWESA
jgi:DNA helicase-2/ATP-dependent DNA helicase PcrA